MTDRPDHVVIVGGGITGLTAAYRFTQAGAAVTVVEPHKLGGKVQTSMFAGRAVDESADNFLLRVPQALALCHDLDLDGELVSPAARAAEVFLDGRRHRLPEGHLLGVPTDLDALERSGILSPAGLARVAEDLDRPADPTDPAVAGGDVAIGPYLRRRMGDEVVDHLIDPLLGGINAGDTATLSLAAVVPQLDAAARSGDPSIIRSCRAQRAAATAAPDAPIFATPLGGMARLVDALLALLPAADLRVGRSVVGLELTGADATRPATGVLVGLDDGTVLDADAVVVACPAHVAGPLLAQVAPEAGRTIGALVHTSASMVALAFEPGVLGATDPGSSGCLIPRDQGTFLSAISFASNKWAQLRDPERDDAILRVSAGRLGDDRHLDLDDADLVERMLVDVDRVVGLSGAPTAVRINRWFDSFPQYEPGHLARMDAVDAELAPLPVRFAGMGQRGVGIPACIDSAERAAASLGASWPTRRSVS
ncbi:MAG: protoporphyrinogen oxidase [Actinobacteria bacterium]|nr:protoporphyrinogen oxidase [Actinomycetota bacterium]